MVSYRHSGRVADCRCGCKGEEGNDHDRRLLLDLWSNAKVKTRLLENYIRDH